MTMVSLSLYPAKQNSLHQPFTYARVKVDYFQPFLEYIWLFPLHVMIADTENLSGSVEQPRNFFHHAMHAQCPLDGRKQLKVSQLNEWNFEECNVVDFQ